MISSLIKKCLNNDRAAQKQLYLEHCQRLMGIAFRYATDMDEAKDIVQNTFIRIFNKLDAYDNTYGNFLAWSKTICIREAIAIKRKNSKIIFKEDIIEIAEKEGQYMEITDLSDKELKDIVDYLPDNHKTILMMFYYDDLSHKEIATLLEIKESSSRSRLTRAKQELTLQWKLANGLY